ncbi:hypothetical protein CMUS01_06014 [Colletotrichum musicola]|uniref:Uncharacterized protein n=1 Tax=Colletotrichum musicola TaxID=2175873 RepID=A0A8H6NJG0_9PEZI|nr:hypothetical protein CMUS01_06014 [Colletotrichum musicola]
MASFPHGNRLRYPPGYKPATTGYHKTINTRAVVGYPKWGFVIYRGTYNDDKLWPKCVALLKGSVNHWLRDRNQEDVLQLDLVWTIVEDRETLDGAPKEAVRTRFRKWAAGRSVERDGPGADGPWVGKRCPRFRFCVYVDQASLDSLTAWWIPHEKYWSLRGQVAMINGIHGHHDEDTLSHAAIRTARPKDEYEGEDEGEDDESEDEEEVYSPIEGNTSRDVGWRYKDADLLVTWYEELHKQGMEWETWHHFYEGERPYCPKVDAGTLGEPLAMVDLSRKE